MLVKDFKNTFLVVNSLLEHGALIKRSGRLVVITMYVGPVKEIRLNHPGHFKLIGGLYEVQKVMYAYLNTSSARQSK